DFAIAERGQLLQFSQAHGENAAEDRFVDASVAAVYGLVVDGAVRLAQSPLARRVADVTAAQCPQPPILRQQDRSARRTAGPRRHVALPPLRREAVQHAADELQQGGLAGLVRAVDDIDARLKPAQAQTV